MYCMEHQLLRVPINTVSMNVRRGEEVVGKKVYLMGLLSKGLNLRLGTFETSPTNPEMPQPPQMGAFGLFWDIICPSRTPY